MSVDLKTLTPGTAASSSVLVGATSAAAASPSLFTTTGSGNVVLSASPTLVTPTLGVATATSINKVALTAPATGSTLTIADGKTLTASNTLTFTGTDGSSVAFGTGGTVLFNGGALGTPSSGTLTNATGLPISTGVSGLGTSVATALAVNAGSAGCFVRNNTAETVSGALTLTSAAPQLTLGVNATTLGSIKLFGSTSGDVTVKAAAVAGTATVFQLPATNGTSGYVLQTDGTGVTSWVAQSGGGGGAPGGASLTIQYNNGGSFAGMSGTSWDDTTRSLTLTGATVTTSKPVLDLSQTWNDGAGGTVTFTGLKLNVTNTASATSSLLVDLQVGGTSAFKIRRDGSISVDGTGTGAGLRINSAYGGALINIGGGGTITLAPGAATNSMTVTTGGTVITTQISMTANGVSTTSGGGQDLFLNRAAAATLQLGAANAAGASATVTASAAADTITWTSHGLQTGSGVRFTNSGGALPGGITTSITYYAVVVDANTIKIATTYDNATAASPSVVDITSAGTGTTTGYGAKTQQSLKVQSFTGTDIPGSPFVIKGSQGTGTGDGGSIIFQVAPAGTTGTAQNALATALAINSAGLLQFAGTTSSFPALKRTTTYLQTIGADGTGTAGFIVGNQALATTATDGFLYIPTCAGTPTGTPTTQTGTSAVVYDTTNNKLYVYNGAWKSATFA